MPFQDPDFPADWRSIGDLSDKNAKWLRIHELTGILDPPKRTKPVLFSVLEADDVKQGQLGDCWLLAAIAAMADFPGHMMDLFSPREYAEDGKYELRFYDLKNGGEWVTITIDDRIPCLSWGPQPCFVQIPQAGDFWVLLLEKAFAKFCGSYAKLDGGGATWAYQVLTGITQQTVYQRKGAKWEQWHVDIDDQMKAPGKWRTDGMRGTGLTSKMPLTTYPAEEFFSLIAYYDQANCLMTASVRGATMEGRRADGLIENHAYSVLEAQQAHGKRMIKLRNPWGGDEWNGSFSDKSAEWDRNPEMAADLRAESANDGEFWMPYEEFTTIYDSMSVSPGNLSVPKQSRVGGKKMKGLACANCKSVMTRVWCMVDMSSEEWVRLQEGDFCFMCRKAQAGVTDFRPELKQIAGLDQWPKFPMLFIPTRPREKPVCKYQCYCYRWNPEHFAEYAHPWLGKGYKPKLSGGTGPPKSDSATKLGDGPPSPPSATGKGEGKGKGKGEGKGSSSTTAPGDDAAENDKQAHEMLNAFKKGDFDMVKDFLRKYPAIVNLRPGRNWALIHRAAAHGDIKYFAPIVMEFNGDMELPAGDGMTPLQIAERGGGKCTEVANWIRERQKTPSKSAKSGTTVGPSSSLPPEDVQRTFLRAGRNRNWPVAFDLLVQYPNVVDCRPPGEKFHAIHHGAFQGDLMVLQTLIDNYNADTTVKDGDGRTALDTAKARGHLTCEIFLSTFPTPMTSGLSCSFAGKTISRPEEVLEGVSTCTSKEEEPDAPDTFTESVLEANYAAKKQNWTRLFEVLASCPEAAAARAPGRNWAVIHHAARWGNLDVIRRLFEEFGVPPNLLSADGKSPADVAEKHRHVETCAFIYAAQVRKAEDAENNKEEKILEIFRKWDEDGNGMISKDELEVMIKSLMPEARQSADGLFKVVDVNADSKISYEEFVAWLFQ